MNDHARRFSVRELRALEPLPGDGSWTPWHTSDGRMDRYVRRLQKDRPGMCEIEHKTLGDNHSGIASRARLTELGVAFKRSIL